MNEEDKIKYGDTCAPQNPWSVQMCITYGCNRAPLVKNRYKDEATGCTKCKGGCMFCGIASLIDKIEDRISFNFMTVDTAINLAKQLNSWVSHRRIEINNFGEPFINPNCDKIIKALRDYYPSCSIQLQTNGVNTYLKGYEAFKELCDKFFNNGGNLLAIDSYEGSYTTYLEFGKRYAQENNIECIDFMHNNPDKKTYYRRADPSTKELYIVDDLGENDYKNSQTKDKKAQRNINNHAGCVDRSVWEQYGINSKELPLKKECTRVFREIIVGFDGTVTICCQDFLRRVNLGNINEVDVRDIWNSKEFNTIRKLLKHKDRNFCTPCKLCSYNGGFRTGFCKLTEDSEVTDQDIKDLADLQIKLSDRMHYNGNCVIEHNNKKYVIESKMSRDDCLKGVLK